MTFVGKVKSQYQVTALFGFGGKKLTVNPSSLKHLRLCDGHFYGSVYWRS